MRNFLRSSKLNTKCSPRSHMVLFSSRNPVSQGLLRRCSTTQSQDKWGSAIVGGRSHVSKPPSNFQRPTVVDHTLDTRSIAATDFGEEEGSTKVVRGISATVPTLLPPFLQEGLQSHTKEVFPAASWDQRLPEIAMLRVLEGWLDKATKSFMHNKKRRFRHYDILIF